MSWNYLFSINGGVKVIIFTKKLNLLFADRHFHPFLKINNNLHTANIFTKLPIDSYKG